MTGADEYEWVQGDARLDAFCFTVVSGVEYLSRFSSTLSPFDGPPEPRGPASTVR